MTPREDWYCACREVAPDRIGTVPVLRPARLDWCHVCGSEAPWRADTPEPVAPQAGIVGAEPDRDDGDAVTHV